MMPSVATPIPVRGIGSGKRPHLPAAPSLWWEPSLALQLEGGLPLFRASVYLSGSCPVAQRALIPTLDLKYDCQESPLPFLLLS